MSKKFTNTDPYDASIDQMWAMLSDQGYHQAKYEALGAGNISFTEFNADSSAITMKNERDVPADLPSFAKKIVGETNHVTQTERWTRSGDSASCSIEIQIKNVPGGTTGYMMQQVIDHQGGYRWLDSHPKAVSARAHRPAYGSDGDYFSKPNREDVFRAVYELMHEADPRRFPALY